MLKKLADFFGRTWIATQWTALYFALLWMLFAFLFRFDILNAADWAQIGSAHLRGPSGLCFGVLAVAALPIYVATVVVIWREKKMLIDSPFKKKESTDKNTDDTPKPETEKLPNTPLPIGLPAELRAPYMNLRRGGMAQGSYSPTVTNTSSPTATMATPTSPAAPAPVESAIPLPDDFNFDSGPVAPTFKDVSFGSDKPDKPDALAGAPIPNFTDASAQDGEKAPLVQIMEKLSAIGFKCEVDGEIIIATNLSKLAIATHADPDFWIADASDWFATGKQKPSPIIALTAAAERHGAGPVLYLAEKNIMNLDNLIKEWQDSGIRVIFDPGEL